MKCLFYATAIVFSLGLILASCKPRNAGPVGNFGNKSFKFDGCRKNGRDVPLSEVPEMAFLKTDRNVDSTWFMFMDEKRNVTRREVIIGWDFDVNRKRTIGYYDFITADGRISKAVLHWNTSEGKPISLNFGEFIKQPYDRLADTVRYFYVPEE